MGVRNNFEKINKTRLIISQKTRGKYIEIVLI